MVRQVNILKGEYCNKKFIPDFIKIDWKQSHLYYKKRLFRLEENQHKSLNVTSLLFVVYYYISSIH